MMTHRNTQPEPFISPADAAQLLGTTIGTLNWRRATRVECPPFWKSSAGPKARVLYLASELDTWRRGEWTGELCRVVGRRAVKAAS